MFSIHSEISSGLLLYAKQSTINKHKEWNKKISKFQFYVILITNQSTNYLVLFFFLSLIQQHMIFWRKLRIYWNRNCHFFSQKYNNLLSRYMPLRGEQQQQLRCRESLLIVEIQHGQRWRPGDPWAERWFTKNIIYEGLNFARLTTVRNSQNLNRQWCNPSINSKDYAWITTPTEIYIHYDLARLKILDTDAFTKDDMMSFSHTYLIQQHND